MAAQLKFTADDTFTIMQFTDLHYRNGEAEDQKTVQLMRELLDAQPPDLVVLTGDVIDGSYCHDPLQSWAKAVQPIIERNLPWAAVFGNHDDEGSANRAQLMTAMQKLPSCLASPGPANLSGVGNNVLTIDCDSKPAANLFFLDSHANAEHEPTQWDWIKQDQIDWYRQSSHDLPALMFFHIPLPEYDDVWNTGTCTGSKYEPVCCPTFNSGLFNALKTAGDVTGVFVGHDHTNDYTGELDGLRLSYGRSTGFASYGHEAMPHGARIIRLVAGARNFQTSICCNGSNQPS